MYKKNKLVRVTTIMSLLILVSFLAIGQDIRSCSTETAVFSNQFVAIGNSGSEFGDYRIDGSQPITINGKELNTFSISYEKTDLKYLVAIEEDIFCTKYYVVAGSISAEYVSHKDFLGLSSLGNGVKKGIAPEIGSKINRLEYFHQKIISREYHCDMDCLKLIVCYYPMLIKDIENHPVILNS